MENHTHYERIEGGSEEEKEAVHDELQELFESKSESLSEHEQEKTPEDKAMIEEIVSNVDEIVEFYGGNPKPLPIEKIHVLEPGSVKKISEGKFAGGIHQPLGQDIGVERKESLFGFASSVAHELFHLKSYKAARVGPKKDARLYRSGFSMIDKKDSSAKLGEEKEYFGILEEAIVAECTKKFMDKISASPMFKKETEALKQIRNWVMASAEKSGAPKEKLKLFEEEFKYVPNAQKKAEQVLAYSEDENAREAYASGMFKRLSEEKEVEWLERRGERNRLYKLLEEIIQKSDGKLKTKNEVFDEFAKANFSGEYLPVARLIEKALGKGSFRKLAEEFAQNK